MKSITKLLIVSALITLSAGVNAQNFGLKAGLNFSNSYQKFKNTILSDDYKMNTGFMIGPVAEFEIIKYLSVETGLLLSVKGYSSNSNISINETEISSGDYNLSLYYLTIPVTAKANFSLGGLKAFVAFGPYFSYAVSGMEKVDATLLGNTTTTESNEIWKTDDNPGYKRTDFGISFGPGIQINQIVVSATYDYGIANVWEGNSDLLKANRNICLSVGYMF